MMLMVVLVASTSFASVVKDISTGWDNAAGQVLGAGVADGDYTVSKNGGTAETAYTLSGWVPGDWWLQATPNAVALISRPGDSTNDAGDYAYTTHVTLTSQQANAAFLYARFKMDSTLSDIQINQWSAGPAGGSFLGFGDWYTLGQGHFQTGDNTITFVVHRDIGGCTGLLVEGNVEVPEPATLGLLSFGGLLLRRRK